MARPFVTAEDVKAKARDGVIEVAADARITPAAEDAAARYGVEIRRREGPGEAPAAPTAVSPLASPRQAPPPAEGGPHVIISAVGRNRSSVLAEITVRIAELNGNVLDITQSIVTGYFTTLLIVDISEITTDFKAFKERMESLSREGDYRLTVQHEDVFRAMHRI